MFATVSARSTGQPSSYTGPKHIKVTTQTGYGVSAAGWKSTEQSLKSIQKLANNKMPEKIHREGWVVQDELFGCKYT
jgi:hypothetical protein